MQISRVFRVGAPVEKHAARFYTRAMFERFSRELYKAMSYTVVDCHEGVYTVAFMLEEGMVDYGYPDHIVEANTEKSMLTCDCKQFEHSGMPCRHIMKVLKMAKPMFIFCFSLRTWE